VFAELYRDGAPEEIRTSSPQIRSLVLRGAIKAEVTGQPVLKLGNHKLSAVSASVGIGTRKQSEANWFGIIARINRTFDQFRKEISEASDSDFVTLRVNLSDGCSRDCFAPVIWAGAAGIEPPNGGIKIPCILIFRSDQQQSCSELTGFHV
jgi:hypothetical protein